ncbi:MAG: thioesterase family protein [Alphaproteobacteria bacterium]|nr:thioesterase family protein [Alphaproteobacteria bacterium]
MDSVFRVDGDAVDVSAHASGPWNTSMQHGGAPSSLAMWAAEALPALAPMRIARLTVDLLRPVPVAPLKLRSEVLREGKKIQLIAVHLEHEGTEVVRANILRVRRGGSEFAEVERTDALDVAPPDNVADGRAPERSAMSFGAGFTLRSVRGEFGKPGPAAIWFRHNRRFIDGHDDSPAMLAAAVSDFSNGISSELDFAKWTFINADVSVFLAREPVGEWILLNAQTWLGNDGGGMAAARLADKRGYFGRAVQNLVVEKR